MNWEQTNEENRVLHFACDQLGIEPTNTYYCTDRCKVVFVLDCIKDTRRLSKHLSQGYAVGQRINRYEVWLNA